METKKSSKEYLKELQEISDNHAQKKMEIMYMIQKSDKIEDKLKNVDEIFSSTEAINRAFEKLDEIEKEYYSLLKEYKDQK